MHDITNLTTNTTLKSKINEIKNKMPNISNLATTSALNTAKKLYLMLVI